jgi:peptidoglycan/LPS O-acetylase OafA/YrhL
MNNIRLTYLDSLRGLAATSVIASHFCISFYLPYTANYLLSDTLLSIIRNGNGAVAFFFVLSGFVLSLKFFTSSKEHSYLQYFIARFFRIYPLFIVVLILSAFSKEYLFYRFDTIPAQIAFFNINWQVPFSFERMISESTLFFLKAPELMLIPQDWTLKVELILSLFIPFLILVARDYPRGFIFIVFFFMKLMPASLFLFHFSLGIAIAVNLEEIKNLWTLVPSWFKYFILMIASVLYSNDLIFSHNRSFLLNSIFINVAAIGAALILVIAVCSPKAQKILNMSMMQFIGKISFGIYLVHIIVLLCLTPFLMSIMNGAGLTNIYLIGGIVFPITLLVTYLISFLLYLSIEKPFISIGKTVAIKFEDRFNDAQNLLHWGNIKKVKK